MKTSEIIVFIVYLLCMLGIGIFFFVKNRNGGEKTYFLGGREMGPWVAALSAGASDMSAWVLMGLPTSIYALGLGQVWIPVGLAIGYTISWLLEAPRLRKFSIVANDSITIPQYLTNRFLSKSLALQVICAIVFLVAYTIYAASSVKACGTLFHTVIGMDPQIAMYLAAVVIVGYTFLGGFSAVCWTDFFQGMLVLGSMFIAPIFAAFMLDTSSMSSLPGGYLNPFSSWQDIVSGLAWGLGYFGMPHILVRFMSIKSSSMIKKSRRIAIVWVIITLVASVAVGVLGYVYLFQTEGTVLEGAASETIFMVLVQRLTPGFIAGILLCAIVAAIMSSSDSQMLVTASAISNDIYKTIFRKEATDKELLRVSKIAVIAVAIIAFVLALNPDNSVMNLVSYAWAGLGAAFGPAMILSLYWKRMTMKGALAGMVSGGLGVLFWNTCLTESSPIFGSKFVICDTGLYELVPAFILSVVVIVVVSLIDKKPSQQVYDEFNRVCTEKFD